MTNHVLLDNITHKDLKVVTTYSADFGDAVGSVLTFPTEFADVQREYPIFLRKDPATGEFQAVAMLGFEADENLFLDRGGWNASYVPAVIARGPFLIGFQNQEVNGEVRRDMVIHVDMDNPRVSEREGEAVFLEYGGNSPYIERISRILLAINDGIATSKTMFPLFAQLDLIEPITLEIEFNNGAQCRVTNYYTVSEEKVAALGGSDLERLNTAGYLQGAFLMIASLGNVKKLIEMKNRRLGKSPV